MATYFRKGSLQSCGGVRMCLGESGYSLSTANYQPCAMNSTNGPSSETSNFGGLLELSYWPAMVIDLHHSSKSSYDQDIWTGTELSLILQSRR